MGGFELLDHTADVGVASTGSTLAGALGWLATGMFSIIVDTDGVTPRQSIQVSVESAGRETLAADWLNELLYRYEAEGFLSKEFCVTVNEEGTSLAASCHGEPYDPKRHTLGTAVKAATYHGLEASHDGQWRLRVILDV